MDTTVNLKLKVIQEGLSSLEAMVAELDKAVEEAQQLSAEAARLRAEVDRLTKAETDASGQSAELRAALDAAEAALGKATGSAQRLTTAQREAATSAGTQATATREMGAAATASAAAMDRANQALREAEAAANKAAAAKNSLIPPDVKGAQAALEAARAQRDQAQALGVLEQAAQAAAAELLRAGASSQTFERELAKPDAVAELVKELGRLDAAVDPAVAERAKQLANELQRMGQQREAIATLEQMRGRTDGLRQAMSQADAAVEDYTRMIGGAKNATAEEAEQLSILTERARRNRLAFLEHNLALGAAEKQARELGIQVERTSAAERDSAAAADKAATATGRMATQAEQAVPAMKGLQTQLTQVAQAVGTYFAAQQAGQALWDAGKVADGWNDIRAALTNALGPQTNINRAMQDAVALSLRTYSSLEATATLYAQLARAGREIGVSQADALRLTETVNKAAQVVKTSAGAAEAGVTQLLQGLRSGVVRGDEFNSVMENSPRLAQAMADGLGVTVGQLRNLAEQGQLTTQVVINALQSQAQAIDTEFARLPLTINRSVSELQTRWAELVGTFDQSSGASAQVARMIEGIANNLDELAQVATRAGAVVVAAMAVQAVTALRAAAAEMIATGAAAKLLRADLDKLGAPVKIVVAVVGLEAGYQLGQLLYENSEYARKLGIGLTAFFENIVNDLRFVKEAGEAIFSDDTVGAAFDRYRQRGKEMDAIFTDLWNNASKAPQAVGGAADAAAGKLGQVGQAGQAAGAAVAAGAAAGAAGLGGMAAKANAVEEALSQLVAAGQAKLPQIGPTIDQQVLKLVQMAGKSKEIAEALGKALPEALAKLNGTDLAAVRDTLMRALSDPAAPAALIKQLIYAVGVQAAQSLGVDAVAASARMTGEFVAAQDALSVLIRSLPELKKQGVDTAAVVSQALAGMVNGAKNAAELDAITARVEALRKAGQLTEVQYIALSNSISSKMLDVADGLNSVADALLGKFGSSVRELQTGISTATAKALGDLDAVEKQLEALGIKGEAVGKVLTRALDQALQTAQTKAEVQAVIDRWEALGKQGKVTGDQLTEGLQRARNKLDEVRDGVNSTAEALHRFGLQSREEMQQTANELGAAWKRIQSAATVSISAKRQAFEQYAKAVMDANGGLVTAEIEVQAKVLGVTLAVQNTEQALVQTGQTGVAAMQAIGSAADAAAQKAAVALNTSLAARNAATKSLFAPTDLAAGRENNNASAGGDTQMSIINQLKQAGVDDKRAAEISKEFLDERGQVIFWNNPGQLKYSGRNSTLSQAVQEAARQELYGKDGTGVVQMRTRDAKTSADSSAGATTATQTQLTTVVKNVINLTVGSATTTHEVETTQAGAEALQSVLTQLASSSRVVSNS